MAIRRARQIPQAIGRAVSQGMRPQTASRGAGHSLRLFSDGGVGASACGPHPASDIG